MKKLEKEMKELHRQHEIREKRERDGLLEKVKIHYAWVITMNNQYTIFLTCCTCFKVKAFRELKPSEKNLIYAQFSRLVWVFTL